MLVLSRKKNESIVINNDITVTVVEIRGDKVRLGIIAPKEMPVHRQEVFDAIHGVAPYSPLHVFEPPIAIPVPKPAKAVKISVDQLVQDLGASEEEVDRKARFTSEGGIH